MLNHLRAAAVSAVVAALAVIGLQAPAHAAIDNVTYAKFSNSTWGTLYVTCQGGRKWAIGAPNETKNYCNDTGWLQVGNPGVTDLHCWYDRYGKWINHGDGQISATDWKPDICATVFG
jgi:hypothetical protein